VFRRFPDVFVVGSFVSSICHRSINARATDLYPAIPGSKAEVSASSRSNALTRDNGLVDLLFLLDKGILDSARIGALHGIFAGHASSHQVIGYSGSI
jgi:hypothetical protein